MRFSTKAIHVGQEPDPRTGAVTVPIYMTSTYSQKAQKEWQYGRTGNPTRSALETNLVSVEDAMRPETRIIWTETPTNPLMKVVDLKELAAIAKAHDALSVCDNTFASPYLQQPLTMGIDLVVHSMTKYLGGHADILGGALVMRRDDLFEKLKFA